MAPQWGSNSKDDSLSSIYDVNTSFSPRNGEVILKVTKLANWQKRLFQSPQWGSNSKENLLKVVNVSGFVSVPVMGK